MTNTGSFHRLSAFIMKHTSMLGIWTSIVCTSIDAFEYNFEMHFTHDEPLSSDNKLTTVYKQVPSKLYVKVYFALGWNIQIVSQMFLCFFEFCQFYYICLLSRPSLPTANLSLLFYEQPIKTWQSQQQFEGRELIHLII